MGSNRSVAVGKEEGGLENNFWTAGSNSKFLSIQRFGEKAAQELSNITDIQGQGIYFLCLSRFPFSLLHERLTYSRFTLRGFLPPHVKEAVIMLVQA